MTISAIGFVPAENYIKILFLPIKINTNNIFDINAALVVG